MVVLAPAIPYIVGGLSAASGIFGALGKQQEQEARNSEIRAQNQAAWRQYNYDVAQTKQNWNQRLKIWDTQKQQYRQQLSFNNQALGQAYFDEIAKSNDYVDKFKQDNMNSYIKLMEVSGLAAARGQTGRRSGMRDVSNAAAFGRNQAQRLANLKRVSDQTKRNLDALRIQKRNADLQAYAPVSVAPIAPLMPLSPINRKTVNTGPALAMGIGNSLLQGAVAGFGIA